MGLPQPFCQPFRDMLRHPSVTPALNTILGEGYVQRVYWRLAYQIARFVEWSPSVPFVQH
jgi:hypothetical protein